MTPEAHRRHLPLLRQATAYFLFPKPSPLLVGGIALGTPLSLRSVRRSTLVTLVVVTLVAPLGLPACLRPQAGSWPGRLV